MRRSVGLSSLTRNAQTNSSYQTHGSNIRSTHIASLTTQFEVFRASLSAFAQSHAKEIRESAEFRNEFARMCSMIGVDPLASTRDVGANGVLGEGMEQFYWELAVRVVEVCRKFREENGGVMEVGEVREVIEGRQKRVDGGLVGGGGISDEDIIRAVETLSPLGNDFAILTIGKKKYIRSVPKELNQDQSVVLECAQVLGHVTMSMLRDNLDWDEARCGNVLQDMMSDSLFWVDDQAEEREFWIPKFGA